MNLNTIPLKANKRHRKTHEDFYFRGETKIVGNENDLKKCKECKRLLPPIAFTTHTFRSDGAYYLQRICRECHTIVQTEHRAAVKKAPPRPDNCDNCHANKKLTVDHIHGTTIFRGWLCKGCNTGMGVLGDTLEGVLQAAIYMEPNTEKIIETLHKVFNKIFARTNEEQ